MLAKSSWSSTSPRVRIDAAQYKDLQALHTKYKDKGLGSARVPLQPVRQARTGHFEGDF